MKESRRKHNPAFKAKVALEAVKGEESIAQLAIRLRFIPVRSASGRKKSRKGPPASLAVITLKTRKMKKP